MTLSCSSTDFENDSDFRPSHHVIGELPTYGYRRVWALLRRQAELDGMPAINAKRVYPGWFVSYKADVVEPGSKYASARYSRGNGALPKDCRIIFFHGKPRPREVSEDWLPLISAFFEQESE